MNDKLVKDLFSLKTHLTFLNNEFSQDSNINDFNDDIDQNALIKDACNRNLLYIVYLNQKNEQFNSISFFILNKWRTRGSLYNKENNKIAYTIKGLIILYR